MGDLSAELAHMDPKFIRPFYDFAAAGALAFPYCDGCETFHWYPKPVCPNCCGSEWNWRRVAPTGRLFTWTVVRHAFVPEMEDRVPFVVGLVIPDGAPNVRIVTN